MGSKSIIKSKSVFQEVLRFEPQKLISVSPESMDELVNASQMNDDFRIADVVKNFTGLAEIEDKRTENEIERRALEELKSIQEQAYSEAFELGVSEGRRQSFLSNTDEIEKRLKDLDLIVSALRDLKIHFLNSNENQIIKMAFYMATKIALFEIDKNSKEAILSVLRQCVSLSHEEETIKISVAPEQLEFLEILQKEKNREFDFLKKVEFSPQEGIRIGGCIIATNYSEIDARVEERIGKLWTEIQSSSPPLKDKAEQQG